MADVLESLVVKLALDGADYDAGVKKAAGSLDGFASSAKDVGGKLSLAVTTPIVGIGLAGVAAASDLNESMSKIDVVFDSQAASIKAWSETSSTSLGQSQQQALEAAGTFGNLFSTMGLGQDESANMSKGMVQLASDLASFNNIGTDEALEKLRSGLVGEAEPLRALGVSISAAAVEAQALKMGLIQQGDELTNAQKAQATYALIMEQTTKAQGDFARTSDGLANSQRIVTAELGNATAELGKELLPIALEAAKGLQKLLGWFMSLSPETKKWIMIIAGVAAAVGPVLLVLGTMAGAISTIIGVLGAMSGAIGIVGGALALLTGPIGLIVLAIAALALAWNSDFLGVKTKTQEFGNWISTSFPQWMGSMKSAWEGFSSWWQSDSTTKIASVQSGWQTFTGWLQGNVQSATNTTKGYWQSHTTEVESLQSNFWATIQGTATTAINAIGGVVQGGLQIMGGDWSGGLNTLQTTAQSAWASLQSLFQTQLDSIRNIFSLFGWADVGNQIAQGIANGVNAGLHWITEAAQHAAQAALDAAKWILGISSPSKAAAKEVGAPFTEGVGVGAVDAVPAAANNIQSALNSLVGRLDMPSVGAAGGAGAGGAISITIYADSQTSANTARLGVLDGLRQAGLA